MSFRDSRLDGGSLLGLLALESELRFNREKRPIDEVRAHLDDILKTYGDVENAPWAIAFGDMMGWALTQAQRDAKDLAAAGQPDPDVEPWRKRVLAFGSSSDTLIQLSAWKALLARPDEIATVEQLGAAKQNDPAAYQAMVGKIWAAAQVQNPLRLGAVIDFDMLTKDIREGPGLFERYFNSSTGKMLRERIDAGMKLAGDYVHKGDAVWSAMKTQQKAWSNATREAERAASGVQAYGAPSSGHASTSTTGGTPSIVAIRLSDET